MKLLLIILFTLLISCSRSVIDLPRFVIDGDTFLYTNHPRSAIINSKLNNFSPGSSDSSKVDYFPGGMQPKGSPIRWINHRLY